MKRNMNRNGFFSLGLCVCLLLSLLCVPAMAETAAAGPYQQFGTAVTWDTTVEQMLAIEGSTSEDDHQTYAVGDFVQYGFMHQTGFPHVTGTMYMFKADMLTLYGGSIITGYQPEGAVTADIYMELLLLYTTQYGVPTITDSARLLQATDAVDEGSLAAENITAYAGWELEDGTVLHLVNVEDVNVVFMYANEARLLGAL